MTIRTLASRLWLLGWFVAWVLLWKRSFSPVIASWGALVFGASGVIAGLFLFVRGFRLLQRKRWIEDTPVSTISGAALGRVKIFGRAAGPYTLISPLAQVDCYYYRAVAREASDERDEKGSESFAEETIFTPLFVEDETGRMLIDPRDADLEIPSEYEEGIETESMSECARRFLGRHGLSTLGNIMVTECAIKPGDPMLVLGTLVESQSRTGSISGRSPEGPYLSREAADLQRREQMEAMGNPVRDLQATQAQAMADFNLHPQIVLNSGFHQEPFVLSRQNPERIVADLARSCILSIWGGAALALFSLGLGIEWLGLW
ncbi:MAG: GIDE domain-containing protein [Candidatus Sulfotelmatobacter sp.]